MRGSSLLYITHKDVCASVVPPHIEGDDTCDTRGEYIGCGVRAYLALLSLIS